MFQIDRKLILALAVSILIMFAGGYFVWQDLNSKYAVSITNKTNANNNASSTPEITVIPVPVNKKPVPTLAYPPEIKANLSAESKVMAMNAIKEIIASLRENPSSESDWINLGLQRNFIGDFIGAKEAWEYASYLRPDDFIPQHNLGDLYTYGLNDYVKAEASYRKSIALDPSQLMVYQKLHELYRFKIKDNSKARAILEEGISKNRAISLWLEKILDEFNASI
ncbi:hypothetical protein A3H04_02345 [Candidatus Giovannonibacteria bacterium RIFCSPLOWO2_12_FULL_43_11c]|uniref:Uncharacterized protein n=1 Tax=Candidatus Giovannonibacteria bacterium RIFCSPHIGHO2_12_FULL_43_15 TaxID=1798341 RepID=A0A1F5WNU5_9BACT|nr:MAG: hypothetical protein A2739_00550 [Candidatus Giovannonibacteria bacterium RIFCSPHIGHO2_01_FULL_43_100]OGF66151.1 MAG: hypothetical protein A3B97_03140 [Candidatus Giovannonibacteria bacterium RIFCSPHIGHO2_02_FULL_43_32]OGF77267.1 MAG: hypothetical protein A3F23_02095 [Candidatus Giovannonibacteria bacterium RIFCSPHIGHO2_12_FULL_43_15]OGF78170.1 MAG: hypothetical protein A3A15_00455 [Candidatus Giovannonibacteria bacterium RIFCSPLOWO2_01_FULL_43_60]OGF92550.1 MAG: hypothetical protein A3